MILRNLKSLIRRYPVAVVLNFTGLVAALLAFALIFLQADYELSFDMCHPTSGRVFRADKKGDERCSGISCRENSTLILPEKSAARPSSTLCNHNLECGF